MNYQQFIKYIDDNIKALAAKKDAKELAIFRHHKSALNGVVIKYELADPELLPVFFHDRFESLLDDYRAKLIIAGKSDTRSPLTRLKGLRNLYLSLTHIETDNTPVSDILLDAAKRMYGDKLFTGEVNPKSQKKILDEYMTIRQLATDIVTAGAEKVPAAWPKVDLTKRTTISSASKVIRDYFTGDSIPTERVPTERISFIEEYLMLPKGTIHSKIIRKSKLAGSTIIKRKRKARLQRRKNKTPEKSILQFDVLNAHLQQVYEEYKAYKTVDEQPPLRNVSNEMKEDKYAEYRLMVNETSRRAEKGWTLNAQGYYPSAQGFYRYLLFFYNYCVSVEGIDSNDVSSDHLTRYDILLRLAKYVERKKKHGSSANRILNFVSLGSQKFGYLRLCADRGNRSIAEFFNDMDFINEKYQSLAAIAQKGIKRRGNSGADAGKGNISFLLDRDQKERRQLCHKASIEMMNKANAFFLQSKKEQLEAKKKKSEHLISKRMQRASFYASKAFSRIIPAVILETCFVVAPRGITWTTFRYFPTANAKMDGVPSITYHSHKNRFEMDVPVYGFDLGYANEYVRLMKNSDSGTIVPINILLPEYLTPLYKKFIEIRQNYINVHMPIQVEVATEKTKQSLNKLKERNYSKNGDDLLKEHAELDLIAFEEFSPDSIELFIPHASYRLGETRSPHVSEKDYWIYSREVRRNFAQLPAKLGESFKSMTCDAFYEIVDEEQEGVNIHATRHLSATTYLDNNPGDFYGAAAILNDSVEQVLKTYGDTDRSRKMKVLGNMEAGFDVGY